MLQLGAPAADGAHMTWHADAEAGRWQAPPADHLLRAVWVGLAATVLILAALAIYPVLRTGAAVETGPYYALLGLTMAGAGGVALVPWPRLLETRFGYHALGAWSVLDIALITGLVAVSGGGQSELYVVYVLTSVFFAASYPPRLQLGLLVLTYLVYTPVALTVGRPVSPGEVVLRLSLLAVVTMMVAFLSERLTREMSEARRARAESDRRAELVDVAARAGRDLNTLDPDRVLAVVADAAMALGFDVADVCVLAPDGETYTVEHARGDLPEAYRSQRHPVSDGAVGLMLARDGPVVLSAGDGSLRVAPELNAEGYRTAVVAPVRVRGRVVCALGAGTRRSDPLTAEEVAAFELLADQASRALENARRFADEHEALQRLEELDRLKNDFLSNVSHELRTPLTVIRGLGVTLTARWAALTEEQRLEFLERVDSNARTLEDVLLTLLDSTRVQAGRLTASRRRVDLRDLVTGTVDRLRPLFDGRELTVQAPEAATVDGDPKLLERVVENLVGNAVKHTPRGTRVQVAVGKEGGEAVFRVSDQGPGIPAEELGHLGERFFRGGEPNTRATRGLGLGLALATEILALHGSELEVSSEVERGSTFGFRLPLAVGGRPVAA